MIVRFLFICTCFFSLMYAIQHKKIVDKPLDLGTFGKTYPIKEKNFYDYVEESRKDFNKTKITQELEKAKNKAYVVSNGLGACKENSFHLVDLTFTLPKDIMFNGKLLGKKGQIINPMDFARVVRPIYILNIDDKDEINFWQQKRQYYIVLAGEGNIQNFSKKYNKQIGKLPQKMVEKFKIKCTPSVITQSGSFYKVTEYKIKREKK